MPILINTVDCSKNQPGTAIPGCLLRLKAYAGFLLVTKPWSSVLATDTFDKDTIIELIQDGTFVPFLNTVDLVRNTPEATKKEYQGGITRTIRNGKPMYSMEFDNGPLWHGNAYAYNSFQQYGIIMIDIAGTIEMAKSADGLSIMPYKLSDFNVDTYKTEVGDDTAGTIIQFQIANEEVYNTRKALLSVAQTGVDVNAELNGILDVLIAGTASVANGLKVTVVAALNGSATATTAQGFGVEGLGVTNFRVRNAATNAVITITTVTPGATPGSYTITPTAPLTLTNTVIVETYDATNTVAVALIEPNQLFRGTSATMTVGA